MNDSSEQFDPEMDEKTVNIRGQQVPMSEVSLYVMNLLKSPKESGSFTEEIIISGQEIEIIFFLLGSSE
jgi:hypothetical protein